jgi:16S rRNA (adenine1518-N6/adenine1519-N6)-dimethyltransferase
MTRELRGSRRRLGQHFLADLDWREQIARAIGVSEHSGGLAVRQAEKDYCWIEIGPGHGEMTEYLAASGVAIHAIELDESLIGNLKRLAKKFPNLDVLQGDILESDLRAIARGRRMRVYGSLPYYITSPILHRLFEFADLMEQIHVVVQTEVAERMAAGPGGREYGYLSVATQLNARPELVLEIPRAAFHPPPEVGSTLVTLRLPGEWARLRERGAVASVEDEGAFLEFAKECFAKKRKTLVNNLRRVASPEKVREALGSVGLRADARAEQIPVSEFFALWRKLRG